MFYHVRRFINQANQTWLGLNCRSAILELPPIRTNTERLTVVTMLCARDILMYLIAIKSFCFRLGKVPQIVVVNDGSLRTGDCNMLEQQIPTIRFVHINDVSTAECPKRGCWERLLLVTDLVENSYVLQIDSDTLTLGNIEEVSTAIEGQRCFTLLGDTSHYDIGPMLSACARAKSRQGGMVQNICERRFDELPESSSLKYVRGSAGFTGFSQGSINREKVIWLSDLMRRIAKEKWDEWGSEQVASNLLIANSEEATALPFPKYLCHWARLDTPYEKSSFIHFVGTHRYAKGFYMKMIKHVANDIIRHTRKQ